MGFDYIPRLSDAELRDRLEVRGAVLVEGPKWCGKTTSARQAAASVVYLQDPETRAQNLRLAELSPRTLLEGGVPRLVDEWQMAPSLWDAVRFEVDERGMPGQFILTGSAAPASLANDSHTGTGRIGRMRMRTMSLLESGDSTGAVSLGSLLAGEPAPIARSEKQLAEIASLTCRGGWPQAVRMGERQALRQARDYLDEVCESDVSRVDGVKRNPDVARAVLRSYARMVSSQGTIANMVKDVQGSGHPASEKSVRNYLDALRKIFVLEDLRAWNPNLRSKTAVRTAPTRHFSDPSIAAAALGLGPGDLISDLETFGLLFEDLCVRDLRAYAAALDGDVFHYRDRSGLEADAVVHLRDGSYALIEIKLGGDTLVAEGAENLVKLRNRIDTNSMREPAFLMVLTAVGDYSYPLENGVIVCPIACLGA
ncbi:MAG: ATP-binding protein [Eggerthellaceae bacterium]|nr:ATP-binding protein [Eggerthellaceae bacterium]